MYWSVSVYHAPTTTGLSHLLYSPFRIIPFGASIYIFVALPEGGAALTVVRCDVSALRHLVVVLRVDDAVEWAVEFDVHRQTGARALHF